MRDVLTALTCLFCLTAPALAAVDSHWTQFRERFPYHIQVIAVSAPESDGTRTLIISEPPPSVTLPEVAAAFGDLLHKLDTRRHRIGFDGWVKDIVAVLPPISPEQLETLVADLSRYMFGTSYKAYALDLAVPPSDPSSYDLMVGTSALNDWLGFERVPTSPLAGTLNAIAWIVGFSALIVMVRRRGGRAISVVTACIIVAYWTSPGTPRPGAAGLLYALHGGEPRTLSELLSEPTTGVFQSETPGLIVLVVPRAEPLNHASTALREFALDSDLLLGAIGTPHSVAVIARERQEPVIALPPLRVETLQQLAAASESELAQSYERLDLFAGRLRSEQRDWAPIFLSPELHDSEYGSLLNITDQLLKSWSEHGNIKYIDFDYPAPPAYPFPNGLLSHANATTVTYNWNTKGVGYVDSREGYEILAFSRTGALPVDYLGEHDSRMREYEDQGYDYFAGRTNDPNLARVVQYAGFYQICRHFRLSATFTPSARVRGGADALQPLARRVLDAILENDLDARISPARVAADADLARGLDEYRELRRALQLERKNGELALQHLARAMVRPREVSAKDASDPGRRHTILLARANTTADLVRAMIQDATDFAAQTYADAEGQNDPDGWIKTPSIVVSWSTAPDGAALVGGHSLSSRISHFAMDNTLPPGGVRVIEENGTRVVFYNGADAGKIRGVVRSVGRNQDMADGQLATLVETGLRTARAEIPAMPAALRLGSRVDVAGRGFVSTASVRLSNTSPWRQIDDLPSSHTRALDAITEPTVFGIVVERVDGRYLVSRAGHDSVLEAGGGASALDAVVGLARSEAAGRTLHLHFRGMNTDQARGFARVAELHTSGPRSVALRTSVEAESGALKVVGEIRSGRWNLAKAEVKLADTVPPNALRNRVDFEIAIPHQFTTARLVARVSIVLKQSVRLTAEMLQQLKQRIEAILQSIIRSGEELDVLLASRRLIHQLRVGDETVGTVEIRLAGDAGDIHIVQNRHLSQDAVGE